METTDHDDRKWPPKQPAFGNAEPLQALETYASKSYNPPSKGTESDPAQP